MRTSDEIIKMKSILADWCRRWRATVTVRVIRCHLLQSAALTVKTTSLPATPDVRLNLTLTTQR